MWPLLGVVSSEPYSATETEFLEELSIMAVNGTIQHGRHYVYRDGMLALHFPSCHAAYTEHCRRISYEGEVPDRKALKRQLDECHRRGGYVREVSTRVCFAGRRDRRRAVLVNLAEVKRTLLVEDFPEPEPDESHCGRDWQD